MAAQTHPTKIALTMGDPFGVGPEVARAALADTTAEVTVYGDPALFPGFPRIVPVPVEGERPARPGPSLAGGRASLRALDLALEAVKTGKHDALVTAPVSKESLALADGPADGHTPYLGRAFGVTDPLMAFVWDDAEPVVALLTTHIPLRAVAAALTGAKVERAVRRLHEALVTRFGRRRARIGVLGVNPHAGEAGLLGTEEEDFVAPALDRLRAEGLAVAGPLPGDAAFATRRDYDGILAMYHDQGLAPVKALAFDRAVNVTLGLPVIRTSPAHGTAFGIAGTGKADPSSMRAALRWAERLTSPPGAVTKIGFGSP
ncbi:MAG TPA: 4-hydroxythreonine-4-phosphate dehydrogenase PdxA [Planctomycetota bacterium]|nr:4-hydroxythreonine-4-phosphate dehydrogenase PdxA [Planctomycetota bacterium]